MAKDINGNEIPTFEQANAMAAQNEAVAAKYTVKAPDNTLLPVDNESDLATAIMSDSYSVNPNEVFSVKKYDGSTGEVSGKDIKTVLSSGDYTLETKEETQLRNDEKAYGSRNLEAGVLGAARGLSFGLTDPILKSTGLYEGDELRGLENANPVASIAGEVGGAVGQAVLSGGTSLLAKGATKVGAGIIASEALGAAAGRAVEKGIVKRIAAQSAEKLSMAEAKTVASLADEATVAINSGAAAISDVAAEKSVGLMAKSLEKAGYATTTAKSIANKMLYGGLEHMAPTAANLAVQGAMQGAGRLVTEDAFGTADFNAENLLAYAGVGSLVGGTFGSAIGLGKALVPSAKSLMSTVGKTATAAADDFISPEKAAIKMFGLTDKQMVGFESRFSGKTAELAKEEAQNIIRIAKPGEEFNSAFKARKENVGASIENLNSRVDEAISEKLAQQESGSMSDLSIPRRITVVEKMRTAVENSLLEKEFISQENKNAVKAVSELLGTNIEKNADKAMNMVELHKLEQKLASEIKYADISKGVALTQDELSRNELLKKARAVIRDERVRQAGLADIGATRELEALNQSYSFLKGVEPNINKSAAKAVKGSGIGVDTADLAVGIAVDPFAAIGMKVAKKVFHSEKIQKAIIMGSLDSSIRTMQNATVRALKALGTGIKETGKAVEPSIVRSLVSSQLAVKDSDGKKIKPKNEQEAYNNIVENANVAVTDPERVLQQSNRQTAAMFEHAPNTAAALDAKYLAIMQFIANKGKKNNKNTGIFDMNKSMKVSGFETAKMARYIDAIANPAGMLDKVSKGKLSREHVEVMKNIYPEMHKMMKTETLNFISKNESKLGYNQKLQLGLLLDMQAHESMQPQNIQALQAQFTSQETASDVNYNQGAVGDMSKSSSLESDLGKSDLGE